MKAQIIQHAEVRHEMKHLENKTNLLRAPGSSLLRAALIHVLALKNDPPGAGAQHGTQCQKQGGFAAATVTSNRQELSGLNFKIHLIETFDPPLSRGVMLAEILSNEHEIQDSLRL